MKSKTSCFNVVIFKKNISHYWPVWVLFLCYLFVVLPVNIWADATNAYYFENMPAAVRNHQIIGSAVRLAITPAPIFLFAAVMALAVFSYLYTAKNANAIHALPVNRLELFITNYLSGLLFLLVPEILAFVAAVMVSLTNQITSIEYLFWWLLCVGGVSFFAYSFAVFVAMFTGLAFAMPFYFVIANYLYVGCMYLVFVVKNLLCYGLMDSEWNPGKSCILSPLYYLSNNLRARVIYDDNGTAVGISVYGWKLVAGYAAAALVFTIAAYQTAADRKCRGFCQHRSCETGIPVGRGALRRYGIDFICDGNHSGSPRNGKYLSLCIDLYGVFLRLLFLVSGNAAAEKF